MSSEHIVTRLKELVNHYETTMRKARNKQLTASTRAMVRRVRDSILTEMKDLIKRL